MKLTLIIALVIILPFTKSYSQITKGNWMVGGSGSFSSTSYNTRQNFGLSEFTLQISPNVGYFFADKFTAGIKTDFLIDNVKDGFHFTNIVFGPFARYYFLPTENKINILTEASYEYGSYSTPSSKLGILSFHAGPVVYFNSSVGMEFTLGYTSIKYSTYSGSDNTIQLGIGFQIHLKKD